MGNDQSSAGGATRPSRRAAGNGKRSSKHGPAPVSSGMGIVPTSSNVIKSTTVQPSKPKVTMQESAETFGGSKQKPRPDKQFEAVVITDALSDVRINYHINPKELGHGHYGVVRKCMNRESKQWYAIKSIRKSKVGKIEVLKREIDILKEVDHPNIIKLVDVYEDTKYLHLITELCTGGELFDRIIAKTHTVEGHFSEHDAAKLIYGILDAIRYCHDIKQIVHRDLKPENFLFLTPDDGSDIKIIDFGLSRHDTQNFGVMKTKVGTPYYVAPEVLNREYTKSCDIWSIGVISYILLCGYPPFYGDSDNEIFESVRTGRFDFPSPDWDDISQTAKDFICSLLKKNPDDRLTAAQAMKHPWLKEQLLDDLDDVHMIDNSRRRSVSHSNDRGVTFKKFLAMQKLKKAALADIASNLTHKEIGTLHDIFNTIDRDGDGTLSLTDLDEALKHETFPDQVGENLKDLREDLALSGTDALMWKEFLAATMDQSLIMREDKIREAFTHFAKGDSKYMQMSDLVAILGGESHALEVLGFVDTDGDGKITFDEFRAAIKEAMDDEEY